MTNLSAFGIKGDGKSDDSAALNHALEKGDGQLVLPRGDYLITRPLVAPLERIGRLSISGGGGTAKLIMAGAGPAIHVIGTHKKSAQPDHFVDSVWQKERMPTIRDLEIEGRHAQADGLRIEGAMQPTLTGLLIRRCRHGIHLLSRDRNVDISDCHIYDNSGIGVYLDRLNLHQINIHGNHISYCKQGGIRISGSEIRNIQICGNDIEYNFDAKADTSADVLFDCREGTIREGTIAANTIQAKFSPGGANVRLIGAGKDNPNAVGLLAISGNLIGSQRTLVHLQSCRGVTLTGNCLYSGEDRAIWAEDAEHLVLGPNTIDHNPEYKGQSTDHVLIERCRHVNLPGLLLQHTRAAKNEVDESVAVVDCENVNITGCQIINARRRGVAVRGGAVVRIADCTIRAPKDVTGYRTAVHADAAARHVMVVNNFVAKGSEGDVVLSRESGSQSGNIVL